MLDMANKPKSGGRGRPPGRKATYVIQARVPQPIWDALGALVRKTRRTKNVELVLALERHLADAGLLPPPGPPPPAP
jgi:hypothetical protein